MRSADTMRKEYRELSEDERESIKLLKQVGEEFCNAMDAIGISREFSIAKTKAEEAVMWAVKGITK